MSADFSALAAAAVSIGFIHCLVGPDHYVPFVAMSRAGGWSWRKTILVTLLCGTGHVVGSAVLGVVGIAMGAAVLQLETAEAARGDLAAWLLCGFGLAYFTWGVVYAVRKRHSHSHDAARSWGMTPWILFTIFLFGPCEPLIPLLMYPAAKASVWQVATITALFGATTLLTMTTMVVLLRWGFEAVKFRGLHHYSHALAGLVLFACGVAIMSGL